MEAARAALTRAENDPDAAAYGQSSISRARAAVSRMQEEADAKQYDAARSSAAEAISAAEKAIADGKTGASQAREETAGLISNLQGDIAEAENSLNSARTIPQVNLDFDGLSRDLDEARQNIAQAESAAFANRFQEALEIGRAVRAALARIQNSIAEGARAASRKK
jgi:hypothetical protein